MSAKTLIGHIKIVAMTLVDHKNSKELQGEWVMASSDFILASKKHICEHQSNSAGNNNYTTENS